MKRTVFIVTMLAVAALPLGKSALAITPSLAGSVVRLNGNGNQTAVAAAALFLVDPTGASIGPNYTDTEGQFVFYDVPPRNDYQLLIQINGTTVWRGAVAVPGRLRNPIVLQS